MTEPVRYTDAVTVRMQEGAAAFVQAKAREIGTKPAEITRQALLAGLRSIGFDPASHLAREQKTNPATPLSQQTASQSVENSR